MESRFSHGSSRSSSNWYNFRRGPGRIMTNTSNVNHEWSFAHPMNNFLNISKSSINNEFSPQSCHCPIPYVLAPQKKTMNRQDQVVVVMTSTAGPFRKKMVTPKMFCFPQRDKMCMHCLLKFPWNPFWNFLKSFEKNHLNLNHGMNDSDEYCNWISKPIYKQNWLPYINCLIIMPCSCWLSSEFPLLFPMVRSWLNPFASKVRGPPYVCWFTNPWILSLYSPHQLNS